MTGELSTSFVECLKRAIANVGGTLKGIQDTKYFIVVTTEHGNFAYRHEWGIAEFITNYKNEL